MLDVSVGSQQYGAVGSQPPAGYSQPAQYPPGQNPYGGPPTGPYGQPVPPPQGQYNGPVGGYAPPAGMLPSFIYSRMSSQLTPWETR